MSTSFETSTPSVRMLVADAGVAERRVIASPSSLVISSPPRRSRGSP
jgi:hypothetical protein